jgi:alpha-glucosidase
LIASFTGGRRRFFLAASALASFCWALLLVLLALPFSALTVVFFSPLQSLYWYGKPLDYTNESELEFFNVVPTVWDESHYLAGAIGKNISVARRKGTTWYVGNVAGFSPWKSSIKLNFLTKGKTYTATVFEDDGFGGIRKKTSTVKYGDVFAFDIQAKGGQAILIKQ